MKSLSVKSEGILLGVIIFTYAEVRVLNREGKKSGRRIK
jgi:hypothetical protein